MKKERNQKLADELKNFLVKNEIGIDTRIYFNEMCYDFDSNGKVALLKDIKASDYFDCANNNTISMSFEGPLYDILNYCSPYHLAKKFYNIFKKYDLFGEQGDSWNLVAYSLSEDLKTLSILLKSVTTEESNLNLMAPEQSLTELGEMKYNIGDKPTVRSDLVADQQYGYDVFVEDMELFLGKEVTIIKAWVEDGGEECYYIKEDEDGYRWTKEMFEDA